MTNNKFLNKKLEEFESQYPDYKIIYLTLDGSKLYGTDNPNSDEDFKGIFIPDKKSVLLKTDIEHYCSTSGEKNSKNTKEDTDLTMYSIYKFFNLLKKQETGAVDLLFSMFREDTILLSSYESEYIKENYSKFLNREVKAFIGYALGQTKKYGIKGSRFTELVKFNNFIFDDLCVIPKDTKLSVVFDYIEENIENFKYIKFIQAPGPRGSKGNEIITYISVLGKMFSGDVTLDYFYERIKKLEDEFGNRTRSSAEGVDFKSLSHALRISLEIKELLEHKFIQFPLKEADRIKEIKSGNCNYEDVVEEIQNILEEVDILMLSSDLPKQSDLKFIDKTIIKFLEI